MAGGKQKELERGTNEYLFGIEWDVVKRLTISGGAQITDYGLSDNFQSDVSFSCDSYSLGFGAKADVERKNGFERGIYVDNLPRLYQEDGQLLRHGTSWAECV